MDLRLFHFGPDADKNWKMKDKLNGWTGRVPCRFLEWTGWYNFDIAERLLGHYRLFQHFKKGNQKAGKRIPLEHAYILQYQASHPLKYFVSRVMAFLWSIFSWKESYPWIEIEGFNRMMVNEGKAILAQFLAATEVDFEPAFNIAMQKFNDPAFFNGLMNSTPAFGNNILVQIKKDFNSIQNNSVRYEQIHIHPTTEKGKGKEADVFSKKQILLLFDLLAESGDLEKIDLDKSNKFDAIADLLHAITGKVKDSFIDELKDQRTHGLYAFHTIGQRNQLIGDLTNLSKKLRAAGFRSVAKLADRKITELDRIKKDS
jgi:hypothetical protein